MLRLAHKGTLQQDDKERAPGKKNLSAPGDILLTGTIPN
jgi:hypothetical protein